MTNQQIAAEINELKPNLTEFWDRLPSFQDLFKEQVTSLLFLQLELLAIYRSTHHDYYVKSDDALEYLTLMEKHGINTTSLKRNGYGYGYRNTLSDIYNSITKAIDSKDTIIGNLDNPRQYLNKYLKSKFRVSTATQVAEVTPENNLFAFVAFSNWLNQFKLINSVQAEALLKKVQRFDDDIKRQYMELIIEKCPAPSIQLQKFISENFSKSSNKYVPLVRSTIRNNSWHTLTFNSVLDYRDSDYKPFVTGLTIKPTISESSYRAMLGSALILKQQITSSERDMVLYDGLVKHLALPESDNLRIQYQKYLLDTVNAIQRLLGDINGHI